MLQHRVEQLSAKIELKKDLYIISVFHYRGNVCIYRICQQVSSSIFLPFSLLPSCFLTLSKGVKENQVIIFIDNHQANSM